MDKTTYETDSDDEIINMTVNKTIAESEEEESDNENGSFLRCVEETDDEETTEARCFSPHTRRSLGLQCNRNASSDDSDISDIDDDDDDNNDSFIVPFHKTKHRANVIEDSSDEENENSRNAEIEFETTTEQPSFNTELSTSSPKQLLNLNYSNEPTLDVQSSIETKGNVSEYKELDSESTIETNGNVSEFKASNESQSPHGSSKLEPEDDSHKSIVDENASESNLSEQNSDNNENSLEYSKKSTHEQSSKNESSRSVKCVSLLSLIELSDDEQFSPPLVQTKNPIQTKLNFGNRPPKKMVSAEFHQKCVRECDDIMQKIAKMKQLQKTSYVSELPDNGARIISEITRLEELLARKLNDIDEMEIEPNSTLGHASAWKNPRNSWDDIVTAADAIQPKYTGKTGMNTFNTNKALTVDRLKQMHDCFAKCPTEDALADVPKRLKIELMEHQRYALSWMQWRERQNPKGGILADDMGLGKTLTIIALVAAKMESNENDNQSDADDDDDQNTEHTSAWRQKNKGKSYYQGGTLVVCPASLLNQWEKEVEERVKRNAISVCVHHGKGRDTKCRQLSKYDMVITTYALVGSEHRSGGALYGIKWERIVLDEAHIIRNHKTKQSEACCALKGVQKWALTGTPIQNKESDLYSLLKFLKCSPFDDFAVYKQWLSGSNEGCQQRLQSLIQPMLLRRTKIQLQEKGLLNSLMGKESRVVAVKLETDEMNVYQKILAYSKTLFGQFLHQRAEREHINYMTYGGHKGPNQAFDAMHKKMSTLHGSTDVRAHQILTVILRLRQICCHPGLIDAMLLDEEEDLGDSQGDISQLNLLAQLDNLKITDDNNSGMINVSNENIISKAASKVLLRTNPVFDFDRASSKFKKVLNILDEHILGSKDKAVVVSQWSTTLDIFSVFLVQKNIEHTKITGSVPIHLRNDIVVEFNKESSRKKVLLLSLTAGGVGLNLTGANHLIIMDPHWNPQLEQQAQDRVYRVGQKKNVVIYNVVCSDTIEERIKKLQERKLALASEVLSGAKRSASSKLTIDDMKTLFGFNDQRPK